MSESSSAERLFHALCERIPAAMERHKVPGVALGVTCDGREFIRGFGFTSISHPLPVDENTLFQIGSTTKTFTATAVMRLIEQGSSRSIFQFEITFRISRCRIRRLLPN